MKSEVSSGSTGAGASTGGQKKRKILAVIIWDLTTIIP
jgi:hypothetical protein